MKDKTGPLYYRIKEDIKDKIDKNEYRKGQMMPTEKELCQEYGVCRVTVRKALEELITEGVLERGFGKSATVSFDKVPRSVNKLSGLFEELEKDGIKCSSFILSQEKIRGDAKLQRVMRLVDGNNAVRIERLRYANGVPLCYQIIYLNDELCGGVRLSNGEYSLYGMLEKEFGVKLVYAEQTIRAVMSDHRMSALLELPEPSCMLLVTRKAYNESKICVEYSKTYYVSGRYEMNMTLKSED